MKCKLNNTVLAIGFAVGSFSSVAVYAADSVTSHSFTANATLASEYLYRGIAQTRGKPALQGGVDYAHSSGLYAGLWGSNISWVDDATAGSHANLEIDAYGGYKASVSEDWGYDLGVLTYNYPGSGKPVGAAQPDTTELYAALNWKWLVVKYSRSTSGLFGWTKTVGGEKTVGSSYMEMNANYDLGNSWGVNAHAGHQNVNGRDSASYTDYKLGVSKDIKIGSLNLAYSTTNAKSSCSVSEDYCLVNTEGGTYDAAQSRVVLSLTKTY